MTSSPMPCAVMTFILCLFSNSAPPAAASTALKNEDLNGLHASLMQLKPGDRLQLRLTKAKSSLHSPLVLKRQISTYGLMNALPSENVLYKVSSVRTLRAEKDHQKVFEDRHPFVWNNKRPRPFDRQIVIQQIEPQLKAHARHFWFLDEFGNIRQEEDADVIAVIEEIQGPLARL